MIVTLCTPIMVVRMVYDSIVIVVIYNIDQGSDKGGSCAEAFGRYKTQCIRCAITKFSACYLFCSYNIQNKTFSDSENNSKSALQNPMHLKSKK